MDQVLGAILPGTEGAAATAAAGSLTIQREIKFPNFPKDFSGYEDWRYAIVIQLTSSAVYAEKVRLLMEKKLTKEIAIEFHNANETGDLKKVQNKE